MVQLGLLISEVLLACSGRIIEALDARPTTPRPALGCIRRRRRLPRLSAHHRPHSQPMMTKVALLLLLHIRVFESVVRSVHDLAGSTIPERRETILSRHTPGEGHPR